MFNILFYEICQSNIYSVKKSTPMSPLFKLHCNNFIQKLINEIIVKIRQFLNEVLILSTDNDESTF